MQKKIAVKRAAFEKKVISKKRRFYDRRALVVAASAAKKAAGAARQAIYVAKAATGLVHKEAGSVRALKKL